MFGIKNKNCILTDFFISLKKKKSMSKETSNEKKWKLPLLISSHKNVTCPAVILPPTLAEKDK